MTALYHPRPERWPQFTLRGLMIAMVLAAVLSATVLPQAIRAYRAANRVPGTQADFDQLIDLIVPDISPEGVAALEEADRRGELPQEQKELLRNLKAQQR